MRTKNIFSLLLFGLISMNLISQEITIDYLGQSPPTDIPEIFAPGIVSLNDRYEYGLAVSPNGEEIFFTCSSPGDGLMRIVKDGDTWSSAQVANLRNTNVWEYEAFYTHAGDSLFFTSEDGNKQQFFYVTKTESEWGEASKLISAVNDDDVMWCSFSEKGNMFYTKISDFSSYYSKKVNGIYQAGEKITNGTHPYVSPDESFFLYNASGDIYIRFKNIDGITWDSAIKLDSSINTTYSETCPSLSPDGKYMFFSRYNDVGDKSDIYWVNTDFIEELINPTNIVIHGFEQNIQIFPNPTKGIISISFGEQPYKSAIVEITNIVGKQILSNTYQNITAAKIDITGNPNGIYLINISIDGKKFHKKIYIE